jgi:hypothetical protein
VFPPFLRFSLCRSLFKPCMKLFLRTSLFIHRLRSVENLEYIMSFKEGTVLVKHFRKMDVLLS